MISNELRTVQNLAFWKNRRKYDSVVYVLFFSRRLRIGCWAPWPGRCPCLWLARPSEPSTVAFSPQPDSSLSAPETDTCPARWASSTSTMSPPCRASYSWWALFFFWRTVISRDVLFCLYLFSRFIIWYLRAFARLPCSSRTMCTCSSTTRLSSSPSSSPSRWLACCGSGTKSQSWNDQLR